MSHPNFVLQYVADPLLSAKFYADLLDIQAIESSPTFALFSLESGLKLGFWARETVLPTPISSAGASELAFLVENDAVVDQRFKDWKARGITIAQPPTSMDFGYTFVALDPDGHRLRVYALSDEA